MQTSTDLLKMTSTLTKVLATGRLENLLKLQTKEFLKRQFVTKKSYKPILKACMYQPPYLYNRNRINAPDNAGQRTLKFLSSVYVNFSKTTNWLAVEKFTCADLSQIALELR